jgi:1-acyl-sn-glycerol-3-phosphate acyltransferase
MGGWGASKREAFYLAWELGIPIVPVAVTGMFDVMHKGSLMIRPGQLVTVHVGQPDSHQESGSTAGGRPGAPCQRNDCSARG